MKHFYPAFLLKKQPRQFAPRQDCQTNDKEFTVTYCIYIYSLYIQRLNKYHIKKHKQRQNTRKAVKVFACLWKESKDGGYLASLPCPKNCQKLNHEPCVMVECVCILVCDCHWHKIYGVFIYPTLFICSYIAHNSVGKKKCKCFACSYVLPNTTLFSCSIATVIFLFCSVQHAFSYTIGAYGSWKFPVQRYCSYFGSSVFV